MKRFILLLFSCAFLIHTANSQGCSDAGFCSLDGIQNSDSEIKSYNNKFTIGSSYGIGDNNITIVASYFSSQRSVGKNPSISTNSADPFRLDFQPSLGTTDIIVGFATNIKKLQINVATQLPVFQGKNTFSSELYDTSNFYSEFQSTNNYKRKGDVLLRATYEVSKTEKFRFTSSLLSIYHLGNDTYIPLRFIENKK